MRPPGAAALLDAWDQGRAASPARRARLLAALGGDGTALPLGGEHAALVAFWRAAFGGDLEAVADCPGCSQAIELEVPVARLPIAEGSSDHVEVEADGLRVTARLPSSTDVEAAASGGDARAALLERCVVEALGPDGPVAGGALPPAVQAALAAAMAEADPAADLRLDLACPACGHRWDEPLVLGALVWAELDAWAWRTLADVAALARAFGWSEAEVLALPPARRAAYLELAEP